MPAKTVKKKHKKTRATVKRKRSASKTKKCLRRKFGQVMREYKTKKLRFARSKSRPTGIPVKKRRQALAIAYAVSQKACRTTKRRRKSTTKKARK